jgi:hypothetical protein
MTGLSLSIVRLHRRWASSTIIWTDKAGPRATGVTSASMTLSNRSGTTIGAFSMSAVSSTGAFKVDTTGSNRIPVHDTWIATFTATIDGATRTWRQAISRP